MRRLAPLLLVSLLAVSAARADEPPAWAKARAIAEVLEQPTARGQERYGCEGAWQTSPGKTPRGDRYVLTQCAKTHTQLYSSGGEIFGVGEVLEEGREAALARQVFQGTQAVFTSRGCVEAASSARVWLARCGKRRAVVLFNRAQKQGELHDVVMIYGEVTAIFGMLGKKP